MKLIKAHFKNFRLLKDLDLDFSDLDDKKLTVIRAANETGKTTCQYGLMWGLFGSKNVLRKDYVLSPKDSITPTTTNVEISVEIDLSRVSMYRKMMTSGTLVEQSVKFTAQDVTNIENTH